MQLTMTVLRCPDKIVPETRNITGGEFTVGRGPGVDWVLPDPERMLSKRHFAIAFRGGGWQIADTSTNGTFLNREMEPLGAGEVRNLRDGDRLRVGDYEIEVRLTEANARRDDSPFADPFSMDPFAPPHAAANPFDEPDHPSLRIPASVQLPPDFDPLAPEAHEMFRGPTQADNSPIMQDAFRPPAQIGQVIPSDDLLPDDWDKDLLQGSSPEPPPAKPAPAPPPAVAAADDALLTAFLTGVGLADMQPKDPSATMLALGKAFRNLVVGLRAVLIARARIKSEFRIEQTVIQAAGNNPLKFSAGDDDALAALLGAGRRTDMAPHDAVADALRDIRLHELATMAAMQAAVRGILEALDPVRLRAQAEQGGGMSLLPAQKKARAWDSYEALHARTLQALADDFDSVFGKAFARAYERSLHEISAKEPGC